jgi:hypothetical protein
MNAAFSALVKSLCGPSQRSAIATEPMLEHEDGAIASLPEFAVEEGSLAGTQPVVLRTRMVR